METDKGTLITKGISCFWKTSSSPTNAGSAMKTTIAQIIAEKLKMDIDDIYVYMSVDTRVTPKHWKTVASMTTGKDFHKIPISPELIWKTVTEGKNDRI